MREGRDGWLGEGGGESGEVRMMAAVEVGLARVVLVVVVERL